MKLNIFFQSQKIVNINNIYYVNLKKLIVNKIINKFKIFNQKVNKLYQLIINSYSVNQIMIKQHNNISQLIKIFNVII